MGVVSLVTVEDEEARIRDIVRADGRAGPDARVERFARSDPDSRAACLQNSVALSCDCFQIALALAVPPLLGLILVSLSCGLPAMAKGAAAKRKLTDKAASHAYVIVSDSAGDMAFATVDLAAGVVVGFHSTKSVGGVQGSKLQADCRLFEVPKVLTSELNEPRRETVLVVRPKNWRKTAINPCEMCWISGRSTTRDLRDIGPSGPAQQVWFVNARDREAFVAFTTRWATAAPSVCSFESHGPGGTGGTGGAGAPVALVAEADDVKLKLAVAVPIDEHGDVGGATVRVAVEEPATGESGLVLVAKSASYEAFRREIAAALDIKAADDAQIFLLVKQGRKIPMSQERIPLLQNNDVLVVVVRQLGRSPASAPALT